MLFITGDRPEQTFELDDEVVALIGRFEHRVSLSCAIADVPFDPLPLICTLLDLGVLLRDDILTPRPDLKPIPAQQTAFALPAWSSATQHEGALVILGACSDAGTLPQYPMGSANGPDAIRDASQELAMRELLSSGLLAGWYDSDTDQVLLENAHLFDAGNICIRPGIMASEYAQALKAELIAYRKQSARVLLLGGDHSLTLAAIESFEGVEIGVIHFDAHSDLGYRRFVGDVNHSNVFRWILDLEHVRHVIQLGVRGLRRQFHEMASDRYQFLSTYQIRERTLDEVATLCRSGLPYYLSVDIDVLDPSAAPDTPAPVPEGLLPTELRLLIRRLGATVRLIGADLMEVMSPRSFPSTTQLVAAELAIEILSAMQRDGNGSGIQAQSRC